MTAQANFAHPAWLVPGVRTPFARVDGGLRALDAVALSVPVVQAMAAQLAAGARPDPRHPGYVSNELAADDEIRLVTTREIVMFKFAAAETILAPEYLDMIHCIEGISLTSLLL